MSHPANASYDAVPYPSLPYAQSHPARLAAIAALLGMTPAPVTHCRVLELGCAGGGNLIPMAYGLPGSDFVGVDNAGRQIEEGQTVIAALGLNNVHLEHRDILDIDAAFGQFDYIIAHGVFSWVPEAVREHVLTICRQNLAPNGVAFVSYNTYPGWHMLRIVRDLMGYQTRALPESMERARQARAFLSAFAAAMPTPHDAYSSYIKMYADFLQGEQAGRPPKEDAFLLHDELEDVNEPFYFHQFMARAAEHGLQYLGEADFHTMSHHNLPPETTALLRQIVTSPVDVEQYLDFLRNRTLRQTLLCHAEVPVSRQINPARVQSLYVGSRARPAETTVDLTKPGRITFQTGDGARLITDHPFTQAAFLCLNAAWPQALAFPELLRRAQIQLGHSATAHDAEVLATYLLQGYTYSAELVEFYSDAPTLAGEPQPEARPIASPIARLQAQTQAKVTNLRHERVTLDELSRLLLPYLDGRHTAADLPTLLAPASALATEDEVKLRLRWLAHAALLAKVNNE